MCSTGQRALVEELLHQRVVAFGHHLDQRFMGLLRGVRQIGRDVAFFALAVAIRGVGVGLHADQVDDALEFALGADRDLDGNGGAAETFCTLARARSKEERSRSSLLMTIARGSLNSSAKLQTFSVCTSTPATPSTTTSAASAAIRAAACR